MQTVEEPVLPLEALDLGAPDQHIRGADRDAFRRIDDPSEVVAALHAADRDPGLGAPSLRNNGSRCAASTSARPDNVSDGPVFTGGRATESASNPSVDQPITSNGVTDQRIAISVRE
ncbi:MAG: hypothetical protein IRZ09_15160 [Variibacter sp.]|nr:hypothetical protein [Variibacter sp.]